MTLAIMQPYFFPYVGYFQLIAGADRGIVFDIVKYNRKSWMNRNRVLHPNGGWQYVSVPVQASDHALIKDARLQEPANALQRILGQLDHYRRHAPFFAATTDIVRRAFDGHLETICDLDVRTLAITCDYLGLTFDWRICSRMDLQLPPIQHAGGWALEISAAVGASTYLNTSGGRDIFHPQEWVDRGIELRFIDPAPFVYATGPYTFEPGLSILDALMWNAPETIAAHLRDTLDASIGP